MDLRNCLLFCSGAALLSSLGLAVSVALLPPDPISQLLAAVPAVAVACAVAYWLVFRGGADRIVEAV